jgi:hypothetical protein
LVGWLLVAIQTASYFPNCQPLGLRRRIRDLLLPDKTLLALLVKGIDLTSTVLLSPAAIPSVPHELTIKRSKIWWCILSVAFAAKG